MTTVAERKVVYHMYIWLQEEYRTAEARMQDNHQRPHFGIYDDEEYRREEALRNTAYDTAKAIRDVCNSVWQEYKKQYSEWDINLAIQENEERIGELKYEKETV